MIFFVTFQNIKFLLKVLLFSFTSYFLWLGPSNFSRLNILMNLSEICVLYLFPIWERLKLIVLCVFVPRLLEFQ